MPRREKTPTRPKLPGTRNRESARRSRETVSRKEQWLARTAEAEEAGVRVLRREVEARGCVGVQGVLDEAQRAEELRFAPYTPPNRSAGCRTTTTDQELEERSRAGDAAAERALSNRRSARESRKRKWDKFNTLSLRVCVARAQIDALRALVGWAPLQPALALPSATTPKLIDAVDAFDPDHALTIDDVVAVVRSPVAVLPSGIAAAAAAAAAAKATGSSSASPSSSGNVRRVVAGPVRRSSARRQAAARSSSSSGASTTSSEDLASESEQLSTSKWTEDEEEGDERSEDHSELDEDYFVDTVVPVASHDLSGLGLATLREEQEEGEEEQEEDNEEEEDGIPSPIWSRSSVSSSSAAEPSGATFFGWHSAPRSMVSTVVPAEDNNVVEVVF